MNIAEAAGQDEIRIECLEAHLYMSSIFGSCRGIVILNSDCVDAVSRKFLDTNRQTIPVEDCGSCSEMIVDETSRAVNVLFYASGERVCTFV